MFLTNPFQTGAGEGKATELAECLQTSPPLTPPKNDFKCDKHI